MYYRYIIDIFMLPIEQWLLIIYLIDNWEEFFVMNKVFIYSVISAIKNIRPKKNELMVWRDDNVTETVMFNWSISDAF